MIMMKPALTMRKAIQKAAIKKTGKPVFFIAQQIYAAYAQNFFHSGIFFDGVSQAAFLKKTRKQ